MELSPRLGKGKDDNQRAARLRDNKRRNRQRQKEYTASLEAKLEQLRIEGVQVTKEVQLSARKVVEDNTRLKALLRHVGVEDSVIETWTPGQTVELPGVIARCGAEASMSCSEKDVRPVEASKSAPSTSEHGSESDASQSIGHLSTPQDCRKECNSQRLNAFSESKDIDTSLRLPPCKVLTRLAENPSADITQSLVTGEQHDDRVDDGVECSKAHNMLMQFATSEEKLDRISQALERSCLGRKGGGCKVPNAAMWKAIDDVT
ncbi:hypothetical protein BKA64DRAFT_637393 [Cadophora sp. MPI-SDFR-AT-0126]|nr:hypothetical protein BKA64DRAFT_637393 [Leotiomycetes sp. MPI-SDFR-AT-0126]